MALTNVTTRVGPAGYRITPERAEIGNPDLDGDLVPDSRDRCPDQPKDPRADPARSDGCPSRVIVTSERIEILEKIQFATGKAVILQSSYPLLADVAATLDANPDLWNNNQPPYSVDGGVAVAENDDLAPGLSFARIDYDLPEEHPRTVVIERNRRGQSPTPRPRSRALSGHAPRPVHRPRVL